MKLFKNCLKLITLAGLVGSKIFSPLDSWAETYSVSSSFINLLPNQWEFAPPDNLDKPDRREAGATRGITQDEEQTCLLPDRNFIALLPPSGKGLTATSYPSFFWYLPATSAKKLEFILRDSQDLTIYTTRYSLQKGASTGHFPPGVMSLTLPTFAGIEPLDIGREYHWELTLICDEDNYLANPRISGRVERVSLKVSEAEMIPKSSPAQQIGIYAQARLWHETVDSLVKLSHLYPQDPSVENAWVKLLDSVGLKKLAQQPSPIEKNINLKN